MNIPKKQTDIRPRWVTEKHYEGIEREVADYWIGAHFWSLVEKNNIDESMLDSMVVDRLIAEASVAAEDHLGDFATEVSERARLWMAWQMKKNNMNKNHPAEYETMKEMIASMIDPDKPRKHAINLSLWLDEILPALESAGVPAEDLVGAQDGAQKMIESAPKIKAALDSGDVNKAAELAHIVASNSLHTMRKKIHEHEPGDTDDKLALTFYQLGDGRQIAVVMCDTDKQRKYLQFALRTIVNEHLEEQPASNLISYVMTELGYVTETGTEGS